MAEQIDSRHAFNGGEIGQLAYDRRDLQKYDQYLVRCRNFMPSIFGPAYRRPGSFFFDTAPRESLPVRFISFVVSNTTHRILVISPKTGGTGSTLSIIVTNDNLNPRWEMSGGARYELDLPFDADEIWEVQYARINDLIYMTHPKHRQRLVSRVGSEAAWSIEVLTPSWPPFCLRGSDQLDWMLAIGGSALQPGPIEVPAGPVTIICEELSTYPAPVLEPRSVFVPTDVGSTWIMTHRREELEVTLDLRPLPPIGISAELFCLGPWSVLLSIEDNPPTGYTRRVVLERREYGSQSWEPYRTIKATKTNPQITTAGDEARPCFLRIKVTGATGVAYLENPEAKLEVSNPDHHTLFKITSYINAHSVGATLLDNAYTAKYLLDAVGTPAGEDGPVLGQTKIWSPAAWSKTKGYPKTVAFHESRLFYGGSASFPQTVWGSGIDQYDNFRLGSNDDLGLSLNLISSDTNSVQWLGAGSKGLAVGTQSEEWVIASADNSKVLTPGTAATRRFGATGSAFIQSIPIRDVSLFVGANGTKIYEFFYEFASDSFRSADTNLMIDIEGGVLQMAVQRSPETTVWVVTNIGLLYSLTYEREQKVVAWARHKTQGQYLSVAVVPTRGGGDQVWVAVAREINGVTSTYLEHFQSDHIESLKNSTGAWTEGLFLDCAVRAYNPGGATVITGLDHLNGESVLAVGDGCPEPHTVLGGSITLSVPAVVTLVGINYESLMETTYIEKGDSRIAKKRLISTHVSVWKSLGGKVSAARGIDGSWEPLRYETMSTPMDSAQPLFTGLLEVKFQASSRNYNTITVRQDQPFPLVVTGLATRLDINFT